MASRKITATPTKPSTLAPARAIELLRKQVEVGRAALAGTVVDRLDHKSWEQTTRALVAAAFGEPSESITRFERASPAYPGRVGANDRFWVQYRHDELEAKIAALSSCITQLEMGLQSPEGAPAVRELHPYEAARKTLTILHEIFLKYGHFSWSISPDGEDEFTSIGLDEEGAVKALRLLVAKNLAEHVGIDSFVITQYGVSACDHPETLDHELPVAGRVGGGAGTLGERRTNDVELDELSKVGDTLESDEIREIVSRDISELKIAVELGLAKSTILLSGSILEGVLIDVLDRNRALASTYMRRRRFPEDASLQDLIGIAGDSALLDAPAHLLTETSIALAKAVTDHRDLIHPHAEARGRIRVDESTARAILHLLSLVVRDLAQAKSRGDIDAYVKK